MTFSSIKYSRHYQAVLVHGKFRESLSGPKNRVLLLSVHFAYSNFRLLDLLLGSNMSANKDGTIIR